MPEIDATASVMLGDSAVMRGLRALVGKIARTPLPVLIQGPTGSGKGMVAKALHDASRRQGRFITANVAALGDGLVESELFGHARGAFTGSIGSRRGLLLHADRGTVFLDEMHRLSPLAQPKLLRVLETQLVRPVGSDDEVKSDFRLIAAANEDLRCLVAIGRFQADLLARLARLIIVVPPLSEHVDDVPALAEHFLRALNGIGAVAFTSSAVIALQEYDWPSNVRELQAIVERAAVMADGPRIDRGDILSAIDAGTTGYGLASSISEPGQRHLDPVAQRERRLIEALRAAGGKVKIAAQSLGVSHKTVYRWLDELGMPTPERRRPSRVGTRSADAVLVSRRDVVAPGLSDIPATGD